MKACAEQVVQATSWYCCVTTTCCLAYNKQSNKKSNKQKAQLLKALLRDGDRVAWHGSRSIGDAEQEATLFFALLAWYALLRDRASY